MRERPLDTEAVSRDDELLNLLGSGESPDTTDPVIQALHAWQVDISTGLDDARTTGLNGHGHRMRPASVRSETPSTEGGTSPGGRHRRHGRRRSTFAAVAIGLSAGLSGVAVAAADAGPGSPLWPITKVIYSDVAAERQAEADAEAALDRARQALEEGRMEDAERYLNEADRQAGAVHSGQAAKLRSDLNDVRSQIAEKQTDDTASEPSAPSETETPTDDDEEPAPTPEVPEPSTSTGAKGEKDKNGPRERNRQESTRDGLEATSPEPTSSEEPVPDLTESPPAL
ncbi:MAG TPA: hypothetical protein VHJ83_12120 [Micromonosporaceae bacterium]|nr:hypothetical protein [Micromonosporaceae bacterium]